MNCHTVKKVRPEAATNCFRASITATSRGSAMSAAKVYPTILSMPRAEHPQVYNFKDLTSQKFGSLTVRHYAGKVRRVSLWACQCDCGAFVVVRGRNMVMGNTSSCGCRASALTSARSTTHGLTRHPLYATYLNISRRCLDPNNPGYRYYGGRGIRCDFASAEEFIRYVATVLGPRPSGHSLDRVDNSGNYAPGNLRWASAKEQSRNRRSNRLILLGEDRVTVMEAAEQRGMKYQTLRARLTDYGWGTEKALNTPVGASKRGDPTC